jgi:membrane associated rhomboid family serine protease
MLVLPYQTQFSLAKLPVVTLGIILACVIVFLGFQSRDEARYGQALAVYNASELPAIEVPRYRQWLTQRGDREALQRLQMLQKQPRQALLMIESDVQFRKELRAGLVIAPTDPQHAAWSQQRARVDALLAQVFTDRYSARGDGAWWTLLTHQFLHGDLGHLIGNVIVLLVAGPFVEAALGRLRFLAGYLASGMVAGAGHLLVSGGAPLIGASGAIAGAMAMVAVLYGTRMVRVFYWVFVYFDTARVPALALLPIWIANEVFQWMASGGESRVAYGAHLGGFAAGALIAWLMRPRDARRIDDLVDAEFAGERRASQQSSLLRQAQDAAARLDTRRAARLYRELVEQHPANVEYLSAYFNVSVLAQTDELHDALLRVLWFRGKGGLNDLRKVYLQMSQPKLLSLLPVDEQLRLARRLVSTREDAAALRVLDRILDDANLRNLYGRQTADCLLGLFTTYSRYGLKQQAASVQQRLARYFPKPREIGGLAPSQEAPPTIRANTRGANSLGGPSTIYIDLSR